jgi:hypothetical protein
MGSLLVLFACPQVTLFWPASLPTEGRHFLFTPEIIYQSISLQTLVKAKK